MTLRFVSGPPVSALRTGNNGLGVGRRRMSPINRAMVPQVGVTVVAGVTVRQVREESVEGSQQRFSVRTESIRVLLPVIIGE